MPHHGDPEDVFKTALAQDRARIDAAIERLSGEEPKPERFLLALAGAWGRPVSCLKWLPPVAPTERGVKSAARWIHASNPNVQRTALAALARAGVAARPVLSTVADALTSKEPTVRIAAARVLARAAPCPEQAPALRRALSDELFTVRWLAVEALARSGDDHPLAPVLAASRPRLDARLAPYQLEGWLRAVAALGRDASALLPEMNELLDRTSRLSQSDTWWNESRFTLERLVRELRATQGEP
ncbi:HEAT repeat domain-containing protein [Sorangium atrum]|uniref:HEAT repeat domain-containing protein n=1 Tax=Sorangium atrum TaxID=2995308 RepID=A0ABT5BUZ2_9BACT|nr:HEAT repeat domain-containing protein [Sorangium aterium]MDC0677553.1 HEAT repeat domain-containing protein [Sorangium aterium]